jgi:hypothetical protein
MATRQAQVRRLGRISRPRATELGAASSIEARSEGGDFASASLPPALAFVVLLIGSLVGLFVISFVTNLAAV